MLDTTNEKKLILVEHEGNLGPVEVDVHIADLISTLNRAGIKTFWSCSSHADVKTGYMCIELNNKNLDLVYSLIDEDVERDSIMHSYSIRFELHQCGNSFKLIDDDSKRSEINYVKCITVYFTRKVDDKDIVKQISDYNKFLLKTVNKIIKGL